MVAYSALRAALKTILAVYRLTQRHVGEEIGEGESPMSLWINNKVGVPQFTDAVRRRVSEKVLKWLQKKHGKFTGQKLDDDDDDDDDDEGKCHPGVIRKKCHCRIDCTRVVRKLSSELDLE